MATDISGSGIDDQDQSEIFDEDAALGDDRSPRSERRTFEELPDVLDVTQAAGDADDDAALIGEDLDDDEIIDLEAQADLGDFEDDDIAGRMPEAVNQNESAADEILLDAEAGLDDADRRQSKAAEDEVELVYAGDLDNVVEETAEADLEADSLDDDDIEDLGYAPEAREAPEGSPRNPTKFEIAVKGHVWVLTRDGKPVHDYGHAERAVHEAAELARELRRTGEPAVVLLYPKGGKVIEITDNERPLALPEEHSAVVPGRSDDG